MKIDKGNWFFLGLVLGGAAGVVVHAYTTCTLFVGGC